jgi:hypothetical protein
MGNSWIQELFKSQSHCSLFLSLNYITCKLPFLSLPVCYRCHGFSLSLSLSMSSTRAAILCCCKYNAEIGPGTLNVSVTRVVVISNVLTNRYLTYTLVEFTSHLLYFCLTSIDGGGSEAFDFRLISYTILMIGKDDK